MAMSGGFHRKAAAHRRNETRALRLMSNVEVKSGTGPAAKKGAHVGYERAGRGSGGSSIGLLGMGRRRANARRF